MSNLANSENPDEMPHKMAFHQDLHCLLKQKKIKNIHVFRERNAILYENYDLGPNSVYTMD